MISSLFKSYPSNSFFFVKFRANLKRWSELVAKKKQEYPQQNEGETTEETKERKEEENKETLNEKDKTSDEKNGDQNEVPLSVKDSNKKTLVEKVKTEALADISFSSDEE